MLVSALAALVIPVLAVQAELHHDRSRGVTGNLTVQLVARQSDSSPVIKVYWNIVTLNGEGDISQERIEKQMRELNDDFRPVDIRFELAGPDAIKRIPAPDKSWWDQLCDKDQTGAIMKRTRNPQAIKRGILSIWTGSQCDMTQLPYGYDTKPDSDGITLGYRDLSEIGQPASHALTHEVGHWSGLPHTFLTNSDECGDGDRVEDTPPHMDPTMLGESPSGCPAVKTCSGEMSEVLGTNFMNYVNPECRKSFTAGQIRAMKKALWEFRGIQFPGEFSDKVYETTPPACDQRRPPNPPWPILNRGTWVYRFDYTIKEVRPMYDPSLTRDHFDKIPKYGWRQGRVVQMVDHNTTEPYDFSGGEKGWKALLKRTACQLNNTPISHGSIHMANDNLKANDNLPPASKPGTDLGNIHKAVGNFSSSSQITSINVDDQNTTNTNTTVAPPNHDNNFGRPGRDTSTKPIATNTAHKDPQEGNFVTATLGPEAQQFSGVWVYSVSDGMVFREFNRQMNPRLVRFQAPVDIIGTIEDRGFVIREGGAYSWISENAFRLKYKSEDGFDSRQIGSDADIYRLVVVDPMSNGGNEGKSQRPGGTAQMLRKHARPNVDDVVPSFKANNAHSSHRPDANDTITATLSRDAWSFPGMWVYSVSNGRIVRQFNREMNPRTFRIPSSQAANIGSPGLIVRTGDRVAWVSEASFRRGYQSLPNFDTYQVAQDAQWYRLVPAEDHPSSRPTSGGMPDARPDSSDAHDSTNKDSQRAADQKAIIKARLGPGALLSGTWVYVVSNDHIERRFDRRLNPSTIRVPTAVNVVGTERGEGVMVREGGRVSWMAKSAFCGRFGAYCRFNSQEVRDDSRMYHLVMP